MAQVFCSGGGMSRRGEESADQNVKAARMDQAERGQINQNCRKTLQNDEESHILFRINILRVKWRVIKRFDVGSLYTLGHFRDLVNSREWWSLSS
jgi:hypothetical protein